MPERGVAKIIQARGPENLLQRNAVGFNCAPVLDRGFDDLDVELKTKGAFSDGQRLHPAGRRRGQDRRSGWSLEHFGAMPLKTGKGRWRILEVLAADTRRRQRDLHHADFTLCRLTDLTAERFSQELMAEADT